MQKGTLSMVELKRFCKADRSQLQDALAVLIQQVGVLM